MAVAVASNRQSQDPRVLGADLPDAKDANGHGCKSIGASPQDQCLLALLVGLHRGKCNHTITKRFMIHAQVHPDAAGDCVDFSGRSGLPEASLGF